MYDSVIRKMYNQFLVKGFITEGYIYDMIQQEGISVFDVDYICNRLISKGVVIGEKAVLDNTAVRKNKRHSSKETDDSRNELLKTLLKRIDESSYNYCYYGQIDYDDIYNEIIELDDGLLRIVEYLKSIKPPHKEEGRVLFYQLKNGNARAKDRAFEIYAHVAVKIALSYTKRYNLPISDTIQDAFLALSHTLQTYNYSQCEQGFSNFNPLVKRNIIHGIMQNAVTNCLTMPASNRKLWFDYFDFEHNYYLVCPYISDYCCYYGCDRQENGNTYLPKLCAYYYVDSNDIACKYLVSGIEYVFNCDEKQAKNLYAGMRSYLSTEELSENETDNYNNYITSDGAALIDSLIEITGNRECIKRCLEYMTSKQQLAIRLRYGVDSGKAMTLEEVADKLDLSRERIRQIEMLFKKIIISNWEK